MGGTQTAALSDPARACPPHGSMFEDDLATVVAPAAAAQAFARAGGTAPETGDGRRQVLAAMPLLTVVSSQKPRLRQAARLLPEALPRPLPRLRDLHEPLAARRLKFLYHHGHGTERGPW